MGGASSASEAVVDHDREIDPSRGCQPNAQRLRAAVRILRQKKGASSAVRWANIRLVHPGVRHDEAKPVLHNQYVAASPHDANRLRQDKLDKPWVLVDLPGKRQRFGGWFDGRQIDDATLGLGNNLLRNDKNVSGARREVLARKR